MRLRRIATLCIVLVAGWSAAGVAPLFAADGADERFPILAWGGPPSNETTPERYRELAEAGFTHSYSSMPDADTMAKALDVAHAAGVQLLVSNPELSGDTEATVKRFKDHPALGGYYLRDEPGAKDFAGLAEWTRRVQAADDTAPAYINLFPNYATPDQLGTATYQAYLDKFVEDVPVPMLSFDHYPVVGDVLRPEWYDNLERAAKTAREAKRPLWAFVLSVAHAPYPVPTVPHLRVQAFSNLAYGARTIQYFTYWTSVSDTWDFHEAPISTDGKRTATYDRVRQVNGEIQSLRGVFQGSDVQAVGHTGEKIPLGTRRYEPAAPVAAVETEGGDGAVVSHLARGGRRFLVVVNRDINRPMTLTVKLDGSARVDRIDKDGSAQPVVTPIHQAQVEPGDVSILAWEQK